MDPESSRHILPSRRTWEASVHFPIRPAECGRDTGDTRRRKEFLLNTSHLSAIDVHWPLNKKTKQNRKDKIGNQEDGGLSPVLQMLIDS